MSVLVWQVRCPHEKQCRPSPRVGVMPKVSQAMATRSVYALEEHIVKRILAINVSFLLVFAIKSFANCLGVLNADCMQRSTVKLYSAIAVSVMYFSNRYLTTHR